jgi:hypothetical protein
LIILDEINSTETHIHSNKGIRTKDCFEALNSYIANSKKIIAMDANLDNDTINALFSSRQTYFIENKYRSYTNLNVNISYDRPSSLKNLITQVKEGKRIVVPTNSLKMCNFTQLKDKSNINKSNYLQQQR